MHGKLEIIYFLFFIQYAHETKQKAKDVVSQEANHCELHLQTKLFKHGKRGVAQSFTQY
jgi:hypothetical protein